VGHDSPFITLEIILIGTAFEFVHKSFCVFLTLFDIVLIRLVEEISRQLVIFFIVTLRVAISSLQSLAEFRLLVLKIAIKVILDESVDDLTSLIHISVECAQQIPQLELLCLWHITRIVLLLDEFLKFGLIISLKRALGQFAHQVKVAVGLTAGYEVFKCLVNLCLVGPRK